MIWVQWLILGNDIGIECSQGLRLLFQLFHRYCLTIFSKGMQGLKDAGARIANVYQVKKY